MRENTFQRRLIKTIEKRLPGSIVLKNDPNYIQGIPDLIVLYKNRWAMLEVKAFGSAHRQPNQPYYIRLFNSMSYASFIFPDNEEEVLNEMERALKA